MRRLLLPLFSLLFCLPVFSGDAPLPRLEFFSPQGSVKNLRQVTARFSVPMVALGDSRLPAPLDVDCPESGVGRWADSRTWVLDFDRDLPSGIACQFRLNAEVKALDGRTLSGNHHFGFDTGGPVIRGSLPDEGSQRIDERQVFVLALDAPAELDSVRAHVHCEMTGVAERIGIDILSGDARQHVLNQLRGLGDDYFYLLSPEDVGAGSRLRGEALKQAESGLLAIQCRRSLPPDTEIRLIWGKGVRSTSGIVGTEERVLSFKTRPAFTARLRCQRVNPQAACLPMLPLEVFFTAEVPIGQLMAVRLVDESGKQYTAEPLDAGKTPVAHALRFRGPFPEKARLRIELPAGLHDDADRPLENAARFPLPVPIDEYPPLAKFSGEFGIIERVAGGILPVTLRNLEPQVEGRQLVVEAADGVPGQVKRLTESDAEIMRWLERVKHSGQLRGDWVTPKGGKADDAVWKEQTGSESVFTSADQPAPMTVPKPLGAKEFEVIGIPLVQPGFYVVELSSPKLGASLLGDKRTRYVATSALVTNLGVHFKWGREGSLVWVTTLDKATPVSGARIQISDYCSGKVLWQGQTTPEGISQVPPAAIPKPHGGDDCSEGNPAPLFVSARAEDDLGFTASFWNKGIQPGDFNLNVGDYLGPEIVHTVFDRPLFRAGESVSMKHFLRRHTLKGFGLPENFQPAFVEITHTGSDQQFRLPVAVDAQGIAESAWAIPRDARLGAYQVALTDARQTQRFESGRFHVEQFRLPTMQALIQPPRDEQINPDEIPLDLHLAYLNGGGASQAPVKLRSLLESREISFSGYENYVFGGETIREGVSEEEDYSETEARAAQKPAEMLPLVLDANGVTRATLKNLPKSRQPRDLIVEMEYQDANGEMEAITRRIPLWPAGINLGLQTKDWVASREQARFHVAALDLRGKPVAHQAIEVDLFERKTYSWRKRLIGGFYAYDNRAEITRLKGGCKGQTDALGVLHCVVKPDVAGEILLQARARDEQGNEAVSVTSLWLAGEDETWFDGSGTDRIDLIPEQREYQPGETARLQVRMPFRTATALVTVEREGVAESFVTTLSGKEPVIGVPIKGEHAPNVFVSVLAVRGRVDTASSWWSQFTGRLPMPWQADAVPPPTALADLGKPAYRLGNAEIKVGWQAHRLDVRVEPAAMVYRPRDNARVHIKVTPADGGQLPADTELALAAVDEALLELKPNPSWRLLDSMMNARPIEVYTSTAQMQVVGKRHFGRKALPHGGGGGRQAARELFDTLLLWKARVPLNGRDALDIDIPLNDSLSAFRVVAVANAGLGLFGTGSGSFQTSQPLMLSSGLAPVVREGDRLSAIFTVRNASGNSMTPRVSARVSSSEEAIRLPALNPLNLDLPPGGAQEAGFEIEIPAGARRLKWDIRAVDGETREQDQLVVEQTVLPAVPVRTLQATLEQIDGTLNVPVKKPEGALPGRGGVEIGLRSRLGEALTGVTDYLRQYPYGCLEQRVSVAIALRDQSRWSEVLSQLPVSLDRDGLLKYFPSDLLMGSDVLTSYVLAIAQEAGWALPEQPRARMIEGLKRFIGGRTLRDSAISAPDLGLRKLAAIEALSRHAEATPELLDSITLDVHAWPTSAVLDWYGILGRVKGIPDRDARRREAEQILRTRLTFHGTTLGFSTEARDALWWLMQSGDVNAVRMVLASLREPGWQADVPKLARGALGRLRRGRWNLTTANAWGVLAMEKFSARFEAAPVTGQTHARMGSQRQARQWTAAGTTDGIGFALPEGREPLSLAQEGTGKPWAMIQVKAALPLTTPLNAGFKLKRTVRGVSQKTPGVWTRGDTARVTLELEAQSAMTWVVVDDPVPAGATILGKGLGREAGLLTRGERSEGHAWPAYEERRHDGFRAYYQFVPKGPWTVEYTVRLNNPGTFVLPATHVEALYAPEAYADYPNTPVTVLGR